MKEDIQSLKGMVLEYGEDLSILAYTLLEDSGKANDLVLKVLHRICKDNLLKEIEPRTVFSFLANEVRKACVLFILDSD